MEVAIYTLLQSDQTLESYVDDRIFHHHLSKDDDINKTSIVYMLNKVNVVSTLDDTEVMSNYDLSIVVVSLDVQEVITIADYIDDLLHNYSDDQIKEVVNSGNDAIQQSDDNRWVQKLNFNVLYQE